MFVDVAIVFTILHTIIIQFTLSTQSFETTTDVQFPHVLGAWCDNHPMLMYENNPKVEGKYVLNPIARSVQGNPLIGFHVLYVVVEFGFVTML